MHHFHQYNNGHFTLPNMLLRNTVFIPLLSLSNCLPFC